MTLENIQIQGEVFMDKQLGIAIIGTGYWGINYVRVFNELPQTKVVAVCDQRSERLQEVERRLITRSPTLV